MYQGTTPSLIYDIPQEVDIDNAIDVYVSFAKNGKTFLTDKTPTIDNNKVIVYLEQEETLKFPLGDVQVQLNYTFMEDGKKKRNCSDIATERVRWNAYNDVM